MRALLSFTITEKVAHPHAQNAPLKGPFSRAILANIRAITCSQAVQRDLLVGCISPSLLVPLYRGTMRCFGVIGG